MTKLESIKDGQFYYGFVYRNEKKDWIFRNYSSQYGWRDSFLTYFKPEGVDAKVQSSSAPNEIMM